MPILGEETSIFPADLLRDFPSEGVDRSWWAVHTKSRQEKSLARLLLRQEIPFYLPLVSKENLIRGRRVKSLIPLFSGYVFLYGSDQERIACLATNRTTRILEVWEGEALRADLQSVSTLIESDAPLTVERRLKPGQRVRIKSGSMAGLEGIVETHRGKIKLVVSVQFLQQGVSVEIDGFMVEPVG